MLRKNFFSRVLQCVKQEKKIYNNFFFLVLLEDFKIIYIYIYFFFFCGFTVSRTNKKKKKCVGELGGLLLIFQLWSRYSRVVS